MASCLSEAPPDAILSGGQSGSRRCRGRPRLTDSDRAQRRLESRKKYDVRRVYLGESHKLWTELRRRTSLSDAGLAEYLILLNSTYGDQYQQEHCRKKSEGEVTGRGKKGRKPSVSRLSSLVRWYQEHSQSCPHEPQLTALEVQPSRSATAVWQCDSDHSFVQYLSSPPREASDSGEEGGSDGECSAEEMLEEDLEEKRKSDEELGETNVCEESAVTLTEEAEKPPSPEASFRDPATTEQPVWDMEASASILSEEAKDRRRSAEELKVDEQEIGSVGCDYVGVPASLIDELKGNSELAQSLTDSAPLDAQLDVPEQTELLERHTLQAVVSSCEIPDQRTASETSQLIIITGPSYEALASEGIQLNVSSENMEEVTCTVIGNVSYNQVCTPELKTRGAEEEDSEEGDKRLLPPAGSPSELSRDRDLQKCMSSCRSKRSRRGPVVEPDGMLKMFHCPYEGCSQVYVAVSSFQNHVNLVHRKGRTKICPHPGCGKKFYLSNHLHRHMIIHSGVRDFICETCGKSFKRKNHLEVHRRTHTGETPLQCEICGYQCRQRASLNWHMKKHTPEAHYNFTCEFCNKRFEKLDSVKFHKLKSHPERQET
ncbi:zinc finger protein 653 isoform X2 [Oryzias melastigma]|uniref:Zinc finger protein 653 n=1 Tax=Oryzias melastigma TaxID=30732 RepID=A0A3B3DEC1_ORYME|nr:zinc finger protein 653 isoform X2 [Oryzias melastigma]